MHGSNRNVKPRRQRLILSLLALVALLWSASTPPSVASNFGSQGPVGGTGTTNGVFLQLNRDVSVELVSLTNTYTGGVTYALDSVYNPTVLNINRYFVTSCTYSRDICVFDNNYGDNGLAGWNACNGEQLNGHPNMKCGEQLSRINTYYSPSARPISCHELGHAMGLRHTTDSASCMRNAPSSSTLTSHDRAHINGWYD